MARRDQYIISKSNFILRKKNSLTSKGTVYEDDQLTLVPEDGIYDEGRAIYSDSNFKFRVRTDINEKKKHFSGKWVENDNGFEEWTYGDCSSTTITKESKIELKPNYSSLSDFAYYGSAVELVKASIRDIVLRYPAGICHLGNNYVTENNYLEIDGHVYYSVANDFNIDVWTPGATEDSVEDPLRVLSASYKKYLYGTTNRFVSYFNIERRQNTCPNSIIAETKIGTSSSDCITLYTILTNGGDMVVAVSSSQANKPIGEPIIRLPQEEVDRIYDELDDFEKVLLDRESKPFFKATLETPYFDGQGYYMSYEDYTCPSYYHKGTGFLIPDLSSSKFKFYVERLLEMARFLDEYDSDNIWRMLTHPSIKNLDWTFKKEIDGEVEDASDFDTTRVKAALELCGRQFDDIKRYADNIKATNTITYNEKNNVPDYFITDNVENDGWEAYHVGPMKDNDGETNVIYSGSSSVGHTSSDANISFMRRLAINSDYIQSLKGTRRGLEVIMGLFGMEEGDDYTIKEYISVASNFPDEDNVRCILPYYDGYYYGDDIYKDWPITVVYDQEGVPQYIIPWFDKNKKYHSGLYFQQHGGWEHTDSKEISIPSITEATEISYNSGELEIYGETLQYIKYASSINELTAITTTRLYDNIVCYVEDISDLGEGYNANAEDKNKMNEGSVFSHYFILKNTALSPFIGYVDNETYKCYGWRNIFEDEFDGKAGHSITGDGARVLYLESLKTVENGNNPHVGYGYYDMGTDYLDHYVHIFKHELENNEISIPEDLTFEGINSIGFGPCDPVVSERKTMAFRNEEHIDNLRSAPGSVPVLSYINEKTKTEVLATDNGYIGACGEDWMGGMYQKLTTAESNRTKSDESAAFSVINTKKIEIEFNTHGSEWFKKYIEDVVLKYIEQMMPATAIFGYKFVGARRMAVAVPYNSVNSGDFYSAEAHAVRADGSNEFMFGWPYGESGAAPDNVIELED